MKIIFCRTLSFLVLIASSITFSSASELMEFYDRAYVNLASRTVSVNALFDEYEVRYRGIELGFRQTSDRLLFGADAKFYRGKSDCVTLFTSSCRLGQDNAKANMTELKGHLGWLFPVHSGFVVQPYLELAWINRSYFGEDLWEGLVGVDFVKEWTSNISTQSALGLGVGSVKGGVSAFWNLALDFKFSERMHGVVGLEWMLSDEGIGLGDDEKVFAGLSYELSLF